MGTTEVFILVLLLHLSAASHCSDDDRCSSGNSKSLDATSRLGSVLDMSCKNISSLDNNLFVDKNATYLISVFLNDNCIDILVPEVFNPLDELRHLYLQNNRIKELHPSIFQSNTRLITLDLSGNYLTELDPNIFEKNNDLSWVKITSNPLKVSALQPKMFNSLNTIDVGICNKINYTINNFQQIPTLRQLNLEKNTVFTVEKLKPYQNKTPEEVALKNDLFSRMIELGYRESPVLRYDPIQKVIMSLQNTSLVCFCDRLAVWFLCPDAPLPCTGRSADGYSLLNCTVASRVTPSFDTSSVSATTVPTATAENQTNFTTSTSANNMHPEPATVESNTLYWYIGAVVIAVLVAGVVGSVLVVRACRKRRNPNMVSRVRYAAVSHNTYDSGSSAPYRRPHGSRDSNENSVLYFTPFDAN